MDDAQLLSEYVQTASQAAFAELVKRYINMVYAAARRQTHDAHTAEDVTQAVFIILARKASSVHAKALAAWLLSTARFAASNAIKLESRRRVYEQRAASMRPIACEPESNVVEEEARVSRLLDEALSKLAPKDRGAVAMRYFQSKSLREIGGAMGISEVAAQKRVTRAVERMRDFFARRGVTLTVDSVSSSLTRQASTIAPAALTPLVLAAATNTAAVAGGASGAVAIANAIVKSLAWVPVKFAAAACVTVAIVAGTHAVVASRSAEAPRAVQASAQIAAPATAAPKIVSVTSGTYTSAAMWTPYVPGKGVGVTQVSFENIQLGSSNGEYDGGLDEKLSRRPGQFAGVVRSVKPSTTGSAYMRTQSPVIELYRGKRIRLSAYLKTDSVERAAGLNMILYGPNGRIDAQDDMSDRAILGTTDWTRYETVADVPKDADDIDLGVALRGGGTLWWDQIELAIVGDDVQVTDDRRWHIYGETPGNYTAALDHNELRNGHPTIRISSDKAGPKEWALYDHLDRSPTALLGKRVKMTAWIKSEDSGGCRLTMRSVGPYFKTLAQDDGYGRRAAKGTMGWMKYSILLNVSPDTQAISSGIAVYGKGKIWIDEVTYEVVGNVPGAAATSKPH